jgi:hypothetical protein
MNLQLQKWFRFELDLGALVQYSDMPQVLQKEVLHPLAIAKQWQAYERVVGAAARFLDEHRYPKTHSLLQSDYRPPLQEVSMNHVGTDEMAPQGPAEASSKYITPVLSKPRNTAHRE